MDDGEERERGEIHLSTSPQLWPGMRKEGDVIILFLNTKESSFTRGNIGSNWGEPLSRSSA